MQSPIRRSKLWTTIIAAALATWTLAPSPAHALNVGYYEMCNGEGSPTQASTITNAGHVAVDLTNLTAADLAPVDVIFVDNCDNSSYGSEYVDHLADIATAVASGKVLVLHDRYVDIAETILPGGSSFDIQRYPTFPDPNNEARDINVLDASTSITNGPGGVITDTTLDNGNYSDHGFAIAGTLPGAAKLVLSTNDPTHIVTFVYTYGGGAVMYSSIPLDYYLGGANAFATIYAVNIIDYAAYLVASCGNGVPDPGEDCDLGAGNGAPGSCCTAGCGFASAATVCRAAVDVCDQAETCSGTSPVCPADAPKSAGEVCRPAAGECDVAETCDGSSNVCPSDTFQSPGTACTDDGDLCTDDECDGSGTCTHPDKIDSDGDGTCDEQDDCTNVAGGQNFVATKPKPNLTFTKVNNDTVAGNDGLKISGSFQLAVGSSFSSVNPITTGARVLVESGSGASRVDQVLPGGALAGSGTRGWKRNAAGTTWTYRDKTGNPLSGIKRMKIADRSKVTARGVKVGVSGMRSTYPIVASDVPLHAVVVLGDQTSAIAGVCGESNFGASSCTFNGPGTTVHCR
jgi:hypothetical protein